LKVLICGDRNWTNRDKIKDVVQYYHKKYKITEIIEGEASGAGRMGGDVAYELKIPLTKVPVNWELYGKKVAGLLRNQEMLNMNPDLILAFHNDISESKGTQDMVLRARRKGTWVILITEELNMGEWK